MLYWYCCYIFGLFLSEWLYKVLRPTVNLMAGIPSVVLVSLAKLSCHGFEIHYQVMG